MTSQRPPATTQDHIDRDTDADIAPLVAIMARLRDRETGCEWDCAQNFATIAPYTIEEAYEVADACERNDMAALCDELGDLLLQVVFHAQMAREANAFSLADVIASICDKLVRRHPHVFGPAGAKADWEGIKAAERTSAADQSALAGVALALPALLRAEKLQKRAARTGFDWPDARGAISKVHEEIEEVHTAETPQAQAEEIGDLLFAVVNWARHVGVDPESALRGANAKFEARFRAMEAIAADGFAALDLNAKEALWVQVKSRA